MISIDEHVYKWILSSGYDDGVAKMVVMMLIDDDLLFFCDSN
jgi:hypothetical protein